MRRTLAYALACVALAAVAVVGLSPLLEREQEAGLLMAGAVATVVQVGVFALLQSLRHRTHGFLAVWAGGALVRLALVGLVAWWVYRAGAPDLTATLLGLAGFLFAMLLMEPAFLGPATATKGTDTKRER